MSAEEGGYVYVLYNPMFNTYGECYKIGQTRDIKSRLNSYRTSYPEKCEIKYITDELDNYKEIEKKVHRCLSEFRMNGNREFFQCNLNTVIECIKENSLLDKEQLNIKINENNYVYKELSLIIEEDKSWLEMCVGSVNLGYNLAMWLLKHFSISTIDKNTFSLKYNGNNSIIGGKELFKKIYNIVKRRILDLLFDMASKSECKSLTNRFSLLKKSNIIRDNFIKTLKSI